MARPTGTRGHSGDEAKLLELVGAIYDAALDPGELPHVLARIAQACGALWVPLSAIPLGPGNTLCLQNTHGLDPALLKLFYQNYNRPETNPSIPKLLRAPRGQIIRREQQFSDAYWERIDMYQEIYRPLGVYASLGVALLRTEHYFVPFGMVRAKSRGAFTARELALFERVIPHMQRLMQILLRLNDLDGRQAADAVLWDRLPFGVFILDASGRILWGNRAGESIVAQNDGLATRGKLLIAGAPDENAALHRLIGQAGITGAGRGLDAGGALALSRPSARRPLAVLVAPFAAARVEQLGRRPAVVVLVSDPETRPQAAPELLAGLYGLTAREAALVALLLEGLDLHDAAERLALSMNTVRTHLRGVFTKTGTRRQAELVSLLLRSVVSLTKIYTRSA
jgi:DNA-binding CsgD family transcriptional regulator/PAS domain-containing protein